MPYADPKEAKRSARRRYQEKRADPNWVAEQRARGRAAYREQAKDPKYLAQRRRRSAEWVRENRKKMKRVARKSQLKRSYGLTEQEYEALLKKQDYRCAICRAKNGLVGRGCLAVDHCHDTGKVRGLLCGKCNRGLGFFQHDSKLLRKAIGYL